MPRAPHPAPSPRTRVRRFPKRGVYDREQGLLSRGDAQIETKARQAAEASILQAACEQEIRPGVPHLVAWPADVRGDLSDRRH